MILSFLSLLNAFCFTVFGLYILRLNIGERLNQLAALVNFCFAFWSLCYAFLYVAPSAQAAMLWHRLSSVGWCLFTPFATHFFLVLSGKVRKKRGFFVYLIIYALPAALIANALFNPEGTSVAAGFVRIQGRTMWAYVSNIKSAWFWLYLGHIGVYFTVALYSTYLWGKKSNRRRFIIQARSIILLDILILAAGAYWDLLLPALNPNVPPATNLIALIWGIGFLFIVRFMKLMSPYEAATPDIILETVMDPILLLNRDGVIMKSNQAADAMLGYGAEHILGRSLSDFFKAGSSDHGMLNELLSGKQLKSVEIDLVGTDGKTISTLSSFSLAESKLDGPVGIVAAMHDVTALKAYEEELQDRNAKYQILLEQLEVLVKHDVLTGLPNRRMLFEELDSAIADYHATGAGFALLYIDLDGFKGINDAFGHSVGDQLLQKAAELFLSSVRRTDTVCRVGGDEFIILLKSGENDEQPITDRLQELFLEPLVVNGRICKLGLSFGISRCPEDAVTGDELIKIADYRMYSEKKRHKRFKSPRPAPEV